MTIQIKTKDGYRDIPGTGVSRLTVENMPEHLKMLDGGVSGTYQATGQLSYSYDWFEGRDARRAAFHQEQVNAVNEGRDARW